MKKLSYLLLLILLPIIGLGQVIDLDVSAAVSGGDSTWATITVTDSLILENLATDNDVLLTVSSTGVPDTLSTADLSSDITLKIDTLPRFVFGAGSGDAGDTELFDVSRFYGSFYNGGNDTIVVTEMIAVLQGTTPSVAVDIEWHATFDSGSAIHLNTTPPTITSVTTGDSDKAFDNDEIPPSVWVWCKTTTVTTEPTFMSVTIMGHLK